jgi:uncharacterized membrane protein
MQKRLRFQPAWSLILMLTCLASPAGPEPVHAQDDPLLGVRSPYRPGHAGLFAGTISTESGGTAGTHIGDRLFFHPCHSSLVFPLVETSVLREAYSSLGGSGAEVFAIVEARLGTDISRPQASVVGGRWLHIDALWRMEPIAECLGCPERPSRLIWRVYGHEPFWSLELGPDSMQWSEVGIEPLQFSVQKLDETEVSWSYSAVPYGEDAPSVSIEITAEPGYDSMSGAWSPCTANVTYGERRFSGWAVPQEPQAAYTFVGVWRAIKDPLPGSDIRVAVNLIFEADFTASLETLGFISRGVWSPEGARTINVELSSSEGNGSEPRRLHVVQHPDGSLYCGNDSLIDYGQPGSIAGTGFERLNPVIP